MRKRHFIACAFLLPGCSGDDSKPAAPLTDASASEARAPDSGGGDATSEQPSSLDGATQDAAETSNPDSSNDGAATDGGGADDAEAQAPGDTGPDSASEGSDAGCYGSWLDASGLDPSIVPEAGTVLLHAAAGGTQDYQCRAAVGDAGTSYTWVFVGPEADLDDCRGSLIGHHFASDAGATAPEWQTLDGTYVIGSKKVAYTPDGGTASVPWLLVQATSHAGTGTLATASWISRANTSGGVAPPSTTCDADAATATQKVSYTADYFFWGQ
jgi:Protein of unknown function (DUF3455)